MKLVLSVVGVLMVALGAIWILQGVGFLPGSFMTGQVQWAVYGGIVAVAGVVVVFWSRRKPAA
ncbi:MAG: hypothetical protein KGO51_00625 [Alphaproteobacteria bacterium]|nr:hypothetical protein [Alphaproteobacteria bacterium]